MLFRSAFFEKDLPRDDAFEQVLCCDISMKGIAFYLTRRPDARQLVITLGAAPSCTYMVAEVAHSAAAIFEGQEGYRIGCRFVRRLENDAVCSTERGKEAVAQCT